MALFSITQVCIAFGRGSCSSDHRVLIQEAGSERVVQEIPTNKPVVDICPMDVNGSHYLAFLCETEVLLYKWS